jgi:hypothetical protein
MANGRNTGATPKPAATDDRLADPDLEGYLEEEASGRVPDDERVVPEDVNEIVTIDEEEEPGLG